MTTSTEARPRMIDEVGVQFGLATGAQVGVLLVAGMLSTGPVATALILIAMTGAVARSLPVLVLLGLGVAGWAWWTGFVVNRFGVLNLAPRDLAQLAAFTLATWLVPHLIGRRGAD